MNPQATASETLSGAQLVVRLLERQGVQTVAGLPGGAILPIYDALAQSRSIRHVLTRHEQGAGFIAQGMPVGRCAASRIWLLLNADDRLQQMIKQVAKLEDVYAVRRHGADHEVFKDLEALLPLRWRARQVRLYPNSDSPGKSVEPCASMISSESRWSWH